MLAGAYGLSRLGPVDGRPLFGYASSFATIIGASLLVPAIIFGLARVCRVPLARLLGVEGMLAHANLAAAIPRLSISVAALAVSLSMMVAVAVMIGSFRDTVAYWIGQTLQADLFVGPGHAAHGRFRANAVRAGDGRRQPRIPQWTPWTRSGTSISSTEGNLVVLGAGHFDIVLAHGSLLFKAPADGRAAAAARDRHRSRDRVRGVREQVRRQPRRHASSCTRPPASVHLPSRRSTTTTPSTAA